jgi:hypothetical protein
MICEIKGGIHVQRRPNVVVEWLKLLLHNRKVPGLNLGKETGYSDWAFFIPSRQMPA